MIAWNGASHRAPQGLRANNGDVPVASKNRPIEEINTTVISE
jgi:hypothetical protein